MTPLATQAPAEVRHREHPSPTPHTAVMVTSVGTKTIMITVPEELLEEIRAETGEQDISSYIAEVLRRKLARDRLGELVAWLEEEYGPITDEERADARREMEEIDAEHARRRAKRDGDQAGTAS